MPGTDSFRVAGRAGTLVREQIVAMIEAAQRTAAEIEREAGNSAEKTLRMANDAAGGLVETIVGLERELTQLHRGVSREADGLRAKLERARRLGAYSQSARAAASEPAPDAGKPELLPSPGSTEVPAARALAEPSPDPPGAAPPEVDREAVSSTPPEDAAPDTRDFRDVDLSGLGQLSDLELAELYGAARIALSESTELASADETYWSAVVVATVEEAITRPDFGKSKAGEEVPGRREKKRRMKLMRPLVEARAEAHGLSEDSDGSATRSGGSPK